METDRKAAIPGTEPVLPRIHATNQVAWKVIEGMLPIARVSASLTRSAEERLLSASRSSRERS